MSDLPTLEADMKTNIVRLLSENVKLKRERDEAREENKKLHDIVERAIIYLNKSYRYGFSEEASNLRSEIEQLKEETK